MNNIKFILTLSLSLIISLNLYSQSKKELREAREAAVAAKVDSIIKAQHLTIEIDRISPMSGRSFSSLDGYTLTINKDTVKTYLPYFGKVTSPSFSSSSDISIDIDESPIDIQIKKNKKDRYSL